MKNLLIFTLALIPALLMAGGAPAPRAGMYRCHATFSTQAPLVDPYLDQPVGSTIYVRGDWQDTEASAQKQALKKCGEQAQRQKAWDEANSADPSLYACDLGRKCKLSR